MIASFDFSANMDNSKYRERHKMTAEQIRAEIHKLIEGYLVKSSTATVTDVGVKGEPERSRLTLVGSDGKEHTRIVPTQRLREIKADFPGAILSIKEYHIGADAYIRWDLTGRR
jgi:hypothetical protein